MYKKGERAWSTCKVVVLFKTYCFFVVVVFFLRSCCRPCRWILKSLMTLIYTRALLGKSRPGSRSRLRIWRSLILFSHGGKFMLLLVVLQWAIHICTLKYYHNNCASVVFELSKLFNMKTKNAVVWFSLVFEWKRTNLDNRDTSLK